MSDPEILYLIRTPSFQHVYWAIFLQAIFFCAAVWYSTHLAAEMARITVPLLMRFSRRLRHNRKRYRVDAAARL